MRRVLERLGMGAGALATSAALAALSALAACGGDGPTADAPSGAAQPMSFAYALTGDVERQAAGTSRATLVPDGYGESDGAGHAVSSPVWLLWLGNLDTGAPQINLGLIGADVRPGTYALRGDGSVPLGASPAFYAAYFEPLSAGGMRQYAATSGTVVVTAVTPRITGTFRFHAGYSVTTRASDAPGTSLTPVPASLDAAGSFSIGRP